MNFQYSIHSVSFCCKSHSLFVIQYIIGVELGYRINTVIYGVFKYNNMLLNLKICTRIMLGLTSEQRNKPENSELTFNI